MAEQQPTPRKPPPPQSSEDEWGTTTRIGYEDRPVHQPRKVISKRKGNRFLRMLGSLLVVVGIAWATYVATSTDGVGALLKPGVPARPVLVLAVGLLILLLEKLIR